MKVGTVRREALRLMFAANGDVLESSDVTELYQNPQYAYYLAGMEMSINRALSRMQSMNVLPKGRVTLDHAVVTGSVATYDLSEIEDFAGVFEVWAQTNDDYTAHTYRWDGGTTLVVPFYQSNVEYVLLYRKKIAGLTPLCADDTELDIPDELACLLPYYIKSELYEEEDYNAAKRARDYFEKGVNAYESQNENYMPTFNCKYAWEEL